MGRRDILPRPVGDSSNGIVNNVPYTYTIAAYAKSGQVGYTSAPIPAEVLLTAETTEARPRTSSSILITWNSQPNATIYIIERATSAAGPHYFINSTSGTSGIDSSGDVYGFTNGTPYYYTISATNHGSGASLPGNLAIASTVPQTDVPHQPCVKCMLASAFGPNFYEPANASTGDEQFGPVGGLNVYSPVGLPVDFSLSYSSLQAHGGQLSGPFAGLAAQLRLHYRTARRIGHLEFR